MRKKSVFNDRRGQFRIAISVLIVFNAFLFLWTDTSSGTHADFRYPPLVQEMLLYAIWFNFLLCTGFALRYGLGIHTDDPVDEIVASAVWTLGIFTPLFLSAYAFEIPISTVARIFPLIIILLLVKSIIFPEVRRFGEGCERSHITVTKASRGAKGVMISFLLGAALLMRFFQGSFESDGMLYAALINKYAHLNYAPLTFPWDLDGGIYGVFFLPLLLFGGAVIAKLSNVHPYMVFALAPVVLVPCSLFAIFALARNLMSDTRAGIYAIVGLGIFTLSRGLTFVHPDVWGTWWPAILYPRNFCYFIASFLIVSFVLFPDRYGSGNSAVNSTILFGLCLFTSLTNLPAGQAVLGHAFILALVYYMIERSRRAESKLQIIAITLALLPNLVISVYGLLSTPSDLGLMTIGRGHHLPVFLNKIATWGYQPYLVSFVGLSSLGLAIVWNKGNAVRAFFLAFLIMVIPFLVDDFRLVLSTVAPTPVTFNRAMLYYAPLLGALCTLISLYFLGKMLMRLTRVNIYFAAIPFVALFALLHYPDNIKRMDYRLDESSRYNRVVRLFVARGYEVQSMHKRVDSTCRILVAGNPYGMGQFPIKELQFLSGMTFTPFFDYTRATHTLYAKPIFEKRNTAAINAAIMLSTANMSNPHWRNRLNRLLREAQVRYILFYFQDPFRRETQAVEVFRELSRDYAKPVFFGAYIAVVEVPYHSGEPSCES
jgi:hypothetical protein